MRRILITNDDGYISKGLYILYEAVKDLGEARIYSTELPRSAIAHTISFNKPLRLMKTTHLGYPVYVTDGSPIDSLYLAMAVHGFKPNIVLSGVNVGENLSLQHIFYSGTIAVAIEAALNNIPAIAFSADVQSFDEFDNPVLASTIKNIAKNLTMKILENGLPRGVDLLSVNFPSKENIRNCIRVVRAATKRWRALFEQRLDTRGRPYYWLQTLPIKPEPGTDVYSVVVEGCVAVTPLSINLNSVPEEAYQVLENLVRGVEKATRKRG
ncbi:MAG: 5'/3'-nucleotidase SurE [Pyrodictiaceae archaeon]